MTKNLYVTPETEVLEVRFEEGFLVISGKGSASNGFNTNNSLGGLGDLDGE